MCFLQRDDLKISGFSTPLSDCFGIAASQITFRTVDNVPTDCNQILLNVSLNEREFES